MKDNNFIVIQGWMCNKLKLSGNDLLVYALIYGFSQDGESKFTGSISYICNVLNISKNTAKKALDGLVERRLIIKIEIFIKKIKFCEYSFSTEGYNLALEGIAETAIGGQSCKNIENLGIAETDPPCQKLIRGMSETAMGGIAETDPNNISLKDTNKTTTTKLEKKPKLKISSSNDFSFLEKNDYSKLNQVTKSNIIKALPRLKEAEFNRCYNLTLLELASGIAEDFNAVLYQGLLGIWIYKAGTLKKDMSKNKSIIKVLTDYEKSVKKYKEEILYKIDSNPNLGQGWKNGFRFEILKYRNIEEVNQLLAKYQIKVE